MKRRHVMPQRITAALGLGALLMTVHLDVWHLFLIQGLATLLGTTLLVRLLLPILGRKWKTDWRVTASYRGILLGSFGAGVCWMLFQRVDVFLLGMLRPLSETGYYSVALTLMDVLVMLPSTIGFVLMPQLAAEKDPHARQKLLLLLLAGVMTVFAGVCWLAAIVGGYLIPWVFGAEFQASVEVYHRLVWAAWFAAGYHVCQQGLSGFGRARHFILAPLAGLVVKVMYGVLFISHGMLAAANATVLGQMAALAVAMMLALPQGKSKTS